MKFIDAHHHLWDLQHCHYPWLMARGVKRFFGDPEPIQRNYLLEDFLLESDQWVPEKSVHIQVGADISDSIKESQWLQTLSSRPASGGRPNAVIAFVDLTARDVQAQLELQRAIPNVRGVRQIVGRHAVEDRLNNSQGLLDNPAFRAGLKTTASVGLSFDLQLTPPQYRTVLGLLESLPELKVAICHAGSPWDQSDAGLLAWREGLQHFAQLPNVCCKVSGLGMFNHDWTLADIRPLVLTVIDVFGPGRTMFGSNFPVDKLYRSYADIWSAFDEITGGFSPSEKEQMFYSNAASFYRI